MLNFSKIRWKNFLSTGNVFTEMSLDSHNTTLIIGENGAGKSTMLDALSFALYGKAFRKINKPQLMNSINQKNLEVEVEFTSGTTEYKVCRGMKPGYFQIYKSGELIDQTASTKDYQSYLEENILKLNYKSFGQVVVLGSSTFVPFMQLPAQSRREVIEDLLDIQIFTTMNLLLKERIAENKAAIIDTKYQTELFQIKLDALRDNDIKIRKMREGELTKLKDKVTEFQTEFDDLTSKIEAADRVRETAQERMVELIQIDQKRVKYEAYRIDIDKKKDRIDKDIHFYSDNDNCPTCKQVLDDEFKGTIIATKQTKKEEIESAKTKLEGILEDLQSSLADMSDIQDQITDITQKINEYKTNQYVLTNSIKNTEKEMESITQELIENEDGEIEKLEKKIKSISKSGEKLLKKKELYATVAVLLKDGGIKTRIIRQYVPIINSLIHKYLAAMDFFVQFELDENFNEIIKSRYRDDFSYGSFSEGEKLRIDLALLFTWRAVAKMRNSVSTNILIMDEIMDSSLDTSGTEEFLKIITDIASDSNIFIISHKGDAIIDKFDRVVQFEKHKNFSRISEYQ